MEIKITSEKKNKLLQRREVHFQTECNSTTPSRLEVKNAVAIASKVNKELVFIRKLETKRGTHIVVGTANIYDTIEQATYSEPKHIIGRNTPPSELAAKKEE